MDDLIMERKKAIIVTESRIKIEDKKIASYGCEVEPHEPLSNWMPIIILCSAIVSFCVFWGVGLYAGVL